MNEREKASNGLTPLQDRFVCEYLKCGSGPQALKAAGGMSKDKAALGRQASALLRKPQIQAEIALRRKNQGMRMGIGEDYELEKAQELLRMCMNPKLPVDRDGNPCEDPETGLYVLKLDSAGAAKALEIMCKIRGKFTHTVKVGLADDLAAQLTRLVDMELGEG